MDEGSPYRSHSILPEESREGDEKAAQQDSREDDDLGTPLRLRLSFSLFEECHQIRLLFRGERMGTVNRSHDPKEERLHCRLRSALTELLVDLRQIGAQRPPIWKWESCDGVAGDARWTSIAKSGFSGEQFLAAPR